MAFTINELREMIRFLEEHPEWRAELRRLLLTDKILELPAIVRELAEAQRRTEQQVQALTKQIGVLAEAQRRMEEQMQALAEAQRRTEQQVQALTEAQRRTEQQVQALAEAQRRMEEQLVELAAAQRRTEQTLERLVEWQQGEAGRREGERYERRIVVRAPNLFLGGEGGVPGEPDVRRRLSQWLRPFYQSGRAPDSAADPFLADLIWWKGNEVVVVEVSQKVNAQDIHRARQRANTLREVGVNATPVVIGEEWATPESQTLAQQEVVEWFVGGGVSQGFLRFRCLSPETLEGSFPQANQEEL
jgi:flagellar biosynthesis GTPase FlhF